VYLSYGLTAVNNGIVATLYIDDDTSVKGDALTAGEMPDARTKMFVPAVDGVCVLSHSWDAVKFFGPNPTANDALQGTSGTSPSEASIYSLHTYDLNVVAATVFAYVKIEYDVHWDEHVTIAAS